MIEIKNLHSLLKIVTKGGIRSYHVQCSYSDGLNCKVLSITFTDIFKCRILGKVSFQYETGRICNYFYQGQKFRKAEFILDLLLDIYNYEKGKEKTRR